jgi:hypothetical protein
MPERNITKYNLKFFYLQINVFLLLCVHFLNILYDCVLGFIFWFEKENQDSFLNLFFVISNYKTCSNL